jgi:hypothetical protein
MLYCKEDFMTLLFLCCGINFFRLHRLTGKKPLSGFNQIRAETLTDV